MCGPGVSACQEGGPDPLRRYYVWQADVADFEGVWWGSSGEPDSETGYPPGHSDQVEEAGRVMTPGHCDGRRDLRGSQGCVGVEGVHGWKEVSMCVEKGRGGGKASQEARTR